MKRSIEALALRESKRPQDPSSLGYRVKFQREMLGLSQRELADMAGLSQPHLSAIELGDINNLGIRVGISIARSLGTDLELSSYTSKPVFISPHSRSVEQLAMASDKTVNIEKAVKSLVPNVSDVPNLQYIEIVQESKNIGQDIRYLRGSMPQWRLAELSGLSQGFISQMEKGEVTPGIQSAIKITKALRVDEHRLLGVERKNYSEAFQFLDRFSRSSQFTFHQKKVIYDRLFQVVSLMQPLVNQIEPLPNKVLIK